MDSEEFRQLIKDTLFSSHTTDKEKYERFLSVADDKFHKRSVCGHLWFEFDAATLDKEIFIFLKKQILHIISDLPFENSLEKYDLEIEAGLKVMLWWLSVHRKKATFGQQLLCLKYKENVSLTKLILCGALEIGFPYLKAILHRFLSQPAIDPYWFCFGRLDVQSRGLLRLMFVHGLEHVFDVFNIFSFLVFLRRGGSTSLIENLCNVKYVSTVKPSERSIGYSHMTRELLWHGTIELFCHVLPYVPKLVRIARNCVGGIPATKTSFHPLHSSDKCSICRQLPIVPHSIGCGHVFCYYCISSSRLTDRFYECPDCDTRARKLSLVSGERRDESILSTFHKPSSDDDSD